MPATQVHTAHHAKRVIRSLVEGLVAGECILEAEAAQIERHAFSRLETNGRVVLGTGTVETSPQYADRIQSDRIRGMDPVQFERWAYGL